MTTNNQTTTTVSEGDRVNVDGKYEATVEYINETHIGLMTSVGAVETSGLREKKRSEVDIELVEA